LKEGLSYEKSCDHAGYTAVYDYYLKKKSEGKKDKQAIVAAMNKFFRIYYARSMEAYRN